MILWELILENIHLNKNNMIIALIKQISIDKYSKKEFKNTEATNLALKT